MDMYNGIVVLSVLYGSEALDLNAGLRKKVDISYMSCLRPTRGVTMRDRMRDERGEQVVA